MRPSAADVRRWAESQRAACERVLAERAAAPPSPREAFERALRLVAFAAALRGWPPPADPRRDAQDLELWERWERLRRLPRG